MDKIKAVEILLSALSSLVSAARSVVRFISYAVKLWKQSTTSTA